MDDKLTIKKIEKYNEKLDNNKRKIVDDIKLLVLFGILILFVLQEGLENESEELIMAGSTLFGSVSIISLVKSIYDNCRIKNQLDILKNERRKK